MAVVRTRRIIDDAGARDVLAAAEREALAQGLRVVVAVVDPWGELVALGRTPGACAVDSGGALLFIVRPDAAQVASVKVTEDKARTAAIYRRESRDFEEQASRGRPSALHLARAVPLQGGVPIEIDGDVVGAVGVSGASSADEDRELALLGAQAVAALEVTA